MTSALDLLMDSDSTAETTTLLESNGICTIDSRTRTIFVPPEIVVGAVQSDKNAERIKFSCPKIVGDNLDLSKFSIRINFENVSSVDPDISIKDQYICEDASIYEANITFSWVIGKNAARYMGTIRFIVCAVKTDSDSNISIEWNTTVAQIPVLEGIEVDQPSLDENNKDIINQLLAITKTASDEAVKNVNSAKEQAITDIQNVSQPDKTLTVEGGIADAKATGNAISSLREDISTKITKFYASSQGKNHLADSDNGKIMDMMLYGKSEQKQYSGDNIYYMDYEDYSQTYNGARITSTKFGYSVSGTFSGTSAYTLTNRYITLAPGTYKMLLKNISALKIGLSKRDYSAITTISEGKTDTTFTLDEETEVCLTIRYSNTTSNETNEIMLTKNLEATSYEPYTGGIPSPNPDYPQEIKSVVNPKVVVYGKNIAKKVTVLDQSQPYTISLYTVADLRPSTTYVLSFECASGYSGYINEILFEQINFVGTGNRQSVVCKTKSVLQSSQLTAKGWIIVKNFTGNTIAPKFTNVMLERISASIAYEPYHEQTVTIPYTLNAIPVSSGGNVTIDGQQYVADYVDVERGKLVRMVGECSIDGTEKWRSEESYMIADISNFNRVDNDNYMTYILCDKYRTSVNTTYDNVIFARKNGDGVVIKDISHQSAVEDWKKYLNNNPCIVYYLLITPTEIDLTPEEVRTFKALSTYYPTTNISVNSEQLDGYTVFNYPISMENGWNYVKQQIGDTREYIYDMDARTQDTDLQAAEAYVNSEYAVALTELEV